MKYKKFVLIPVLFFVYIFFVVDFLASFNFTTITQGFSTSGGYVQTIGVGEGIGVSVMRPYFFGLITLPVYASSLGNIAGYHETFFWFLGLLTTMFVLVEWRNTKNKVVGDTSGERILNELKETDNGGEKHG